MPQWGSGWRGCWFQGGLGLRARSDGRTGQFRYDATGGRKFGTSKRFGLRLSLSGVVPLDAEGNGLPSDQEQYFGLQLGADWRATRALGVFFQVDGMIPPPKEQPLGGRLNLGLAWKLADGGA